MPRRRPHRSNSAIFKGYPFVVSATNAPMAEPIAQSSCEGCSSFDDQSNDRRNTCLLYSTGVNQAVRDDRMCGPTRADYEKARPLGKWDNPNANLRRQRMKPGGGPFGIG